MRRWKKGINDFETIKKAIQLIEWQKDENILILYKKYKHNPKIKWKESIKKIVGIELPLVKGLDV